MNLQVITSFKHYMLFTCTFHHKYECVMQKALRQSKIYNIAMPSCLISAFSCMYIHQCAKSTQEMTMSFVFKKETWRCTYHCTRSTK